MRISKWFGFVFFCLFTACFVFSADAIDEIGYCGENIMYTYDAVSKAVFISGDGKMTDYTDSNESPFFEADIESVFIEDGITSVGNYAFFGCEALSEINLPETVVSIGDMSFEYCSILSDISFPLKLSYIGSNAFSGCESLVRLVIPAGIDTLLPNAFFYCDNLTEIMFLGEIKSVGDSAFGYCESLELVHFVGNTVTAENITIGSDNSFFTKAEFHSMELKGASSDCISGSYSEGYYCSACEKWMHGHDKLSEGSGHRFFVYVSDNNADCFNDGTKTSKCENCDATDTMTDIGSAVKHKNAYSGSFLEATCTNTGLTSGLYCPDCNGWIVERVEIPKSEHQTVAVKGIKATCTQSGLTDGEKCSFCGMVTLEQEIVSKKDHIYKPITIKATLTKNGKIENKCTCGKVKSTTTVYYPETIKLSKTEYTYNGKVQTPSVTVKDSKGNALKKDIDYTVKYESGCKLPGTYTVTVTFKGKYEGTKELTYTIAPKATSKITAKQTITTITLSWSKVTGADGYRVYKYNSKTKKYDYFKSTTGTSLKISDLKAGTSYKYKVRAYTKDDGTIYGAYSDVFATATKCKTPTVSSIYSKTKGKAVVKWSNVAGESGYQLYYSASKNGTYKKAASYAENKTAGSKIKLKSGKKYYFKVRAYKKTASGTVYSSWSSIKSVKAK